MSATPQLDLLLALAAGRLLLRRSDDAGLTRIAAAHLDTTSPQALSSSIASGGCIHTSGHGAPSRPATMASASAIRKIASWRRWSRIIEQASLAAG